MNPAKYFEAGFRPSLHNFNLSNEQGLYIAHWKIVDTGTPFPTENGRRAAYWHGQFNFKHEAPVIAASTPPKAPLEPYSPSEWYVGIANEQELITLETADDQKLYFADAADYGVANLPTAIHFLQDLLPVELAPVSEQ